MKNLTKEGLLDLCRHQRAENLKLKESIEKIQSQLIKSGAKPDSKIVRFVTRQIKDWRTTSLD